LFAFLGSKKGVNPKTGLDAVGYPSIRAPEFTEKIFTVKKKIDSSDPHDRAVKIDSEKQSCYQLPYISMEIRRDE